MSWNSKHGLNAFERRDAIKDMIAQRSEVDVHTLAKLLQTSEVTIRRDLALLEGEGVLRRVRGGALVAESGGSGQSFILKRKLNAEQKRRIGRTAAGLIRPGERLILDSGTTVLEVARQLISDTGHGQDVITVITNSLPVVQLLGHRQGFEVIVIGGQFLSKYEAVAGPQATHFLQDFKVDKFIMAADGLSLEHGATADHPLEAELMRAMAACAREIVLVADSSKIGHVGFVTVLPLGRIHCLVTDTGAPEEFVREAQALGMRVLLA